MKKQILFIVVFLLAAFAGVNKVYAQPGHLTPTPGTEYIYAPTYTSAGGSSPTYEWYVTQNTDLTVKTDSIKESAGFFSVKGNNTSSSININWTAASVNQTYYLVIINSETMTLPSGCIVSNMKVYQIKPASTLLLTVYKANADGTTNSTTEVCAPTLQSAIVTPGASPTVTYLYNQTVLYYKIKAEGMLGTWRPSLSLPALPGATPSGQTYASVEWATYSGVPTTGIGTWGAFPTAGTLADLVVTVPNPNGLVANTNVPVAVAGTEYLVRVTINNTRYESLSNLSVPLAVDGYLPVGYTVSDIIGSGATPWAQAAAFAKSDSYTILARPTIVTGTTTTPASPFINQVP